MCNRRGKVMSAEKHKSQRSDSRLTPEEARIGFPFFHEKRKNRADGTPLEKEGPGGDVLLRKKHLDPAQCPNYNFLAALCMEAAAKAWPGAGWPAGGKWPI